MSVGAGLFIYSRKGKHKTTEFLDSSSIMDGLWETLKDNKITVIYIWKQNNKSEISAKQNKEGWLG